MPAAVNTSSAPGTFIPDGGMGQKSISRPFSSVKSAMLCISPPPPENAERGKIRFLIEFSEYARLNIPNAWKGDRNPVKYARLDDLEIDPAKLTWETVPDVAETPRPDSREAALINGAGVKALTMAEAKKGLALTFNVPPEAIEITIRG